MLAEELLVLDSEDMLWQTARPLLDVALRLDQSPETFTWHGWQRGPLDAFLRALPSPCSLVLGVWESLPAGGDRPARDKLVLGIVCKVERGEIRTVGTLSSLVAAGLKPVEDLEIGIEDALDVIHYARKKFAPVAWALFTEKVAWNEWLFAEAEEGEGLDKGSVLRKLTETGRCVLMGSQAAHQ